MLAPGGGVVRAHGRWVKMRHLGMYMLMNGSSAANWVPRWGLPSLIPFILQAQGFPEASTATLLGAFFPVRPPPPDE